MVGETIAHYKIIDKLGQGGMGEVFLAEDTKLDRKVALKFLPDSLHQDPVAEKRFLREAKSAAALDHPFICHVHEVGEDNGKSFISMEYVSGENLKDRLAKGPLPLKEALEIATEIAEALETAHKANIVHRDLKPSNIMLTPDGHVKVMDFGLAKQLVAAGGVGSQEQTGTAGLTETGMTLGTLTYMSPEQLRGRTVDTRSDIFSFGIVLYEMLTDIHPFKKPEPMETASSILIDDPPPLSQYLNGVSPVLEHTVRKMLAKNPDQRYQATREVKIDLEAPMGESGFSFPAGSQVSVVKYAAGLGLVLAFGAAIWLYLGSTPSDSPLPPPKVSMFAGYPGQKRYPDISPDGRQITFAWEGQTGGNFDIYVKLVGAGRPLQLTTHPGDDLCTPHGLPMDNTLPSYGVTEVTVGFLSCRLSEVPRKNSWERILLFIAVVWIGPPTADSWRS